MRSLLGGTGGGGAERVGTIGTAVGPVLGRGGTAGPGGSATIPFIAICEKSPLGGSFGGGGGGDPGSPRTSDGGGGGASIPGLPRSVLLVLGAGAGGAVRVGSCACAFFIKSLRGFGTGGTSSFTKFCANTAGLAAGSGAMFGGGTGAT